MEFYLRPVTSDTPFPGSKLAPTIPLYFYELIPLVTYEWKYAVLVLY